MMTIVKRFILPLLLSLIVAAPALAQTWPPSTVRIMVPFGPGSTPDVVARLIANQLKAKYPSSDFVVENKPGASGDLGTATVALAKPDGATIGISIGGPLAINTLLYSNLPYNPKKDIAAVTQLITQPSVLAVSPSLKVNTVAELVTLLKANPGKYNFASIGTGSLSQLAMEALAIKSGTKIVHVAYKSSPQAILAIIRGDVQMACMPAASVVKQAEAGKVKMLAVSTAKRSPYLPKVPTLKESGIDVEADAWMGLIAPGGTPQPIVDKINGDVVAIMKTPAIKQKLATYYMEPVGSSPTEFRALIDHEVARWAPVIEAAHIKKVN